MPSIAVKERACSKPARRTCSTASPRKKSMRRDLHLEYSSFWCQTSPEKIRLKCKNMSVGVTVNSYLCCVPRFVAFHHFRVSNFSQGFELLNTKFNHVEQLVIKHPSCKCRLLLVWFIDEFTNITVPKTTLLGRFLLCEQNANKEWSYFCVSSSIGLISSNGFKGCFWPKYVDCIRLMACWSWKRNVEMTCHE